MVLVLLKFKRPPNGKYFNCLHLNFFYTNGWQVQTLDESNSGCVSSFFFCFFLIVKFIFFALKSCMCCQVLEPLSFDMWNSIRRNSVIGIEYIYNIHSNTINQTSNIQSIWIGHIVFDPKPYQFQCIVFRRIWTLKLIDHQNEHIFSLLLLLLLFLWTLELFNLRLNQSILGKSADIQYWKFLIIIKPVDGIITNEKCSVRLRIENKMEWKDTKLLPHRHRMCRWLD